MSAMRISLLVALFVAVVAVGGHCAVVGALHTAHDRHSLALRPTPSPLHAHSWSGLSNRHLRQFIADRGGRCDGCVERRHLQEAAAAVAHLPTEDDLVVSMLTPLSMAASTRPGVEYLRPLTESEARTLGQQRAAEAVLISPDASCESVWDADNRTRTFRCTAAER